MRAAGLPRDLATVSRFAKSLDLVQESHFENYTNSWEPVRCVQWFAPRRSDNYELKRDMKGMADAHTKLVDDNHAMGRTHNLIEPSLSRRDSP